MLYAYLIARWKLCLFSVLINNQTLMRKVFNFSTRKHTVHCLYSLFNCKWNNRCECDQDKMMQVRYYQVCLVLDLQTPMVCSSKSPGSGCVMTALVSQVLCITERSQLSWTILFLLWGKNMLKLVLTCVLTSLFLSIVHVELFKNTVEFWKYWNFSS